MLHYIQKIGYRIYTIADSAANSIFGTQWNPLYHLGTLAFFFFYIVLISGIYIYIFYKMSVQDAYISVEYLTHEQWYFGGIMRSLHRYASDAMIVTVILHLLRGFFSNRYHGARWFSWVTGIPMLLLVFALGIIGYWLVWDKMGQFIAVRTAEWIDWLPIVAEPTARNFLSNESITDLFFRLLVVIHIGLPLMLLGAMLLHVNRLNHAKINPPLGLAMGATMALLVLSIIKPAVSHEPADLSTFPSALNFDWFFMFIYPLMDSWSIQTVWIVFATTTLLLLLLPWISSGSTTPVAKVYPEHCSGCNLCVLDCPYEAIRLEPQSQPNGLGSMLAVVHENKCTSCGVCVGSCPSSSPFRQIDGIHTGIDLPDRNIQNLYSSINESLAQQKNTTKVLVFGCDYGVPSSSLPSGTLINLPCIGALPPSFIVYALRNGADGVVLTGCRDNDCYHRLGNQWTLLRFSHQRKPYLSHSVPRERVRYLWAAKDDLKTLENSIETFRLDLSKI